jgi:hypothetical protein
MKHYFRYRYWLAASLNFGLKLQLLYRRHARHDLPTFKVIGEKVSV